MTACQELQQLHDLLRKEFPHAGVLAMNIIERDCETGSTFLDIQYCNLTKKHMLIEWNPEVGFTIYTGVDAVEAPPDPPTQIPEIDVALEAIMAILCGQR